MMNVSGRDIIEALRSVLKKVERLRRRKPALPTTATEPIAIIAMSCRFPGGVESPEKLWRLFTDGADAIGTVPPGCDVPTPAADDLAGGALSAAAYSAGFPGEAPPRDPQQRLLMEIAGEAFDNAGIDPGALRRSATGVFVGSAGQDYTGLVMNICADLEGIGDPADSVLSDRLSSSYALRGPAVTVNTGCSSSLVAVHLAVQSLRSGESSLAFAGGVALMAAPVLTLLGGPAGWAAAAPRKVFADPMGRSEGACLLLLERLSDARRNKREVLGIVRASAVNNGGAPNSRSLAGGPEQHRLIGQALLSAGLSAADVDAIEADGTGVPSSDRIEAQALLATYGHDRVSPLYLGSIRSHLGNAQAVAGVAGMIKMVLAMRHGVLPGRPHVVHQLAGPAGTAGAVELRAEGAAWPRSGRPRRAAVSSFGAGGTNAHVILEQPEATAPAPGPLASGVSGGRHRVDLPRRAFARLRLRPSQAQRLNNASPSGDAMGQSGSATSPSGDAMGHSGSATSPSGDATGYSGGAAECPDDVAERLGSVAESLGDVAERLGGVAGRLGDGGERSGGAVASPEAGPDDTTIAAGGGQDASVQPTNWPAPDELVDDVSPAAAGRGNLLRLTWTPISAPGNRGGASEAVVVPIMAAGADAAAEAHTLTAYAMNRIEEWLAEDRPAAARLMFTTRGAIAAKPGDPVDDVAAAAVWGVVRAAQAAHPGQFVLVDEDAGHGPSPAALLATGEPQLLVRGDAVLAGRLVPCDGRRRGPSPAPWDPQGTVLITGSAGGIAGELARHLVAERNIRHLLMVSQYGRGAPGAVVLQAELIAHGVQITFVACDLADRVDLARVIAAVPSAHPLTAVVHTTGALGNGAATSLISPRQSAALAPKADGAWHLHELTRRANLAAFVTFSPIPGAVGNPGNVGNAAANAFLDALAQHRAASGLPATSIAWSGWKSIARSGWKPRRSSGRRRSRHVRPVAMSGILPMSTMDALALFDVAVCSGAANLVAIGGLTTRPLTAAGIPAVLSDLICGGLRRPSARDQAALEPPPGLRLEWVPAPAVAAGAITWSMLGMTSADSPPTLIMAEVASSPGADVGDAVHEITMRILGLTHQWLADRRYEGRPLVVHTHHAVLVTRDDRVEDLAGAAAWGVVRAVQAEHPGRFILLDGDVDERTLGALPGLIATGNAQFAVRGGALLVGRAAISRPD